MGVGDSPFRFAVSATAACVLGLLLAPQAESKPATVPAGTHVDVTGPRLSAGQMIWAQRRKDRGLDVRSASLPNLRSPSTLFSFLRNTNDETDVSGRLVASPSLVAMYGAQVSPGNRYFESYTSLLGLKALFEGAVKQITGACPGSGDCGFAQVAADGSRLLFDGPRGSFRIQDLATGVSKPVAVEGSSPLLAGRYVASATGSPTHVVVFDHETATEALRVPANSGPLSLQADGKVLFNITTARGYALAWASPQQPYAHILGVRAIPNRNYEAVIQNDRVAFSRDGRDGDAEIGIVGLTGPGQVLVRSVLQTNLDRLFDFDGERLAWAQRTCSGQQMATATVTSLKRQPVRTARRRCQLRGARIIALPDSFSIRFSCAGLSRNCRSENLVIRAAETYRVRGRLIPRDTKLTRPSNAGIKPTYVRYTGPGQRLADARKRFQVTVTATLSDDSLYKQRRQASVTVRRAR